jgi:hypothetical protein
MGWAPLDVGYGSLGLAADEDCFPDDVSRQDPRHGETQPWLDSFS